MIFFIAGASHAGKTALAQKLMERTNYPYLSIDHLKMGLIRAGYTALTPESPDAELTGYLWPVVREIAKTAIENGQNLIIEGCYIPFDWKDHFEDVYLPHIRYRCLILTDRYIEQHYPDIKAYANVIENRMDDINCSQELLLQENREALRLCQLHGAEYFLIDESYPNNLADRF